MGECILSKTLPKPNILITGVTSGLGLELAKLYQHERLILIGRQPRPESDLFQKHLYIQSDLSRPDAALLIAKTLEQHHIHHLDLLIHNAAMGYYGHVARQTEKNLSELLQVNVYTPIALTQALLKYLDSNGKVVFINSVAAHMAAPDYAIYAASKAALSGFARNIRIEGLRVQTIYPGAIQTSFHEKSGVPRDRFAVNKFPSAEITAKKIYKAIQTNKPEVTIGFINKLARATAYYVPNLFDFFVKRKT